MKCIRCRVDGKQHIAPFVVDGLSLCFNHAIERLKLLGWNVDNVIMAKPKKGGEKE